MRDHDLDMTALEKDALEEIMNISFGQAAADLSEVMNLSVSLTVPFIDILLRQRIVEYIQNQIADIDNIGMVKQFFSGRFSGSSVLIFPHGEGKKLLQLFNENAGIEMPVDFDIDELERESLIEIANIIMGACISKIAEILGDVVTYSPPRYYSKAQIKQTLQETLVADDSFAIFFKTRFHFKEFDASGFLFLISDYETLEWLKKAICQYLSQYA